MRASLRKPKGAGPASAVSKDPRISALRRFAVSITVLTILGLTVLGFEEAYATPVVAVLTACLVELTLETVEARAYRRPARYHG
ncbi:MAG: enediyne biosynthesis protein, partial [Pseudonocardiales bacterium]|nr:enediyne biosynthesis protein [Pseudonocardiales bacterium]